MWKRLCLLCLVSGIWCGLAGCSLISAPFRLVKGTVTGTVWAVKTTYEVTAGTTKVVYRIGGFTYEVVKAPIEWALTHEEIESIDDLPAREAIRQDRVKTAPYVVKGKRYVPMSVEEAQQYREAGVASWYGYESGRMTATGEAFNPNGLTAAHKTLPIPMFVQVTNLENGRSLIVRVNDRGPFPGDQNPRSGDRIIDLSLGAARRLGYRTKGTTRVRVEAIQLREE
ncbi:MAG TPA: septal ring lytic transglycosylase RlpA family protein [Candidatus Methylomirabilis sp.]|nr:septal ring lytic transglycosylase RlpA family protein [Candidatus Methylomirabilis sp.]